LQLKGTAVLLDDYNKAADYPIIEARKVHERYLKQLRVI